MIDIGIGMLFAFMASLCAGGLIAWSWTLYRLAKGLSVYPPEPRLPATWGFAEVLLCVGGYILLIGVAGVVLSAAGVPMQPPPVVEEETLRFAGEIIAETSDETPAVAPALIAEEAPDAGDAPADGEDSAGGTPIEAERLGALILADGLARTLAITGVLALLLFQDRQILERFGWMPQAGDFALGLVASCMLLPLVFGIQAVLNHFIPYEHPVLEIIRDTPATWVVMAMAVTTMIIAPLVEEFFFRGLLQGWMQRVAASDSFTSPQGTTTPRPPAEMIDGDQVASWPWWPIVVSSILFALVHWGHGAAPVALFFLALGLGFLYRVTGRLWASITVHFVLNTISTLMSILIS